MTLENEVTNDTKDINNCLNEEVNRLNLFIDILNSDLKEANTEIKNLQSHISQLESLVIRKEEEIINLIENKHAFTEPSRKASKQSHILPFTVPLNNSFQALTDCTQIEPQLFTYQEQSFPPLHTPRHHTPSIKSTSKHAANKLKRPTKNKLPISLLESPPKLSEHTKKRRVVIVTDSHGHGLSKEVDCRTSYSVCGFVRPAATLRDVTKDIKQLTQDLTKDDLVVVIGGTNDLEKRGIASTIDDVYTLQNYTKHTNLLLASVPMRHDKPQLQYKVSNLNDRLSKRISPEGNTTLLPLHLLPRHLYTPHGLHFNTRGKSEIGRMIARMARSVFLGFPMAEQHFSPGDQIENFSTVPQQSTDNIRDSGDDGDIISVQCSTYSSPPHTGKNCYPTPIVLKT